MILRHSTPIRSLEKLPSLQKILKPMVLALMAFGALMSSLASASASNPVPHVNQPLVPATVTPGGPAFTLTVNGSGFVSGATVNWNGSARATTWLSGEQLTASIQAADIATVGTASVTVVNPTPGGGTSNVVFLPITNPTASVTFSRSDLALSAGAFFVATGEFLEDRSAHGDIPPVPADERSG